MMLTLLIAGSAIAFTILYVMVHSAAPVLAGEQTAVGLGDPAAETLGYGDHPESVKRTDWRMTTLDNLSEAEDLLDCLENQGVEDRELVVLGNACFAVRWR